MELSKKNIVPHRYRRFLFEVPAYFIGVTLAELAIYDSYNAWIGSPLATILHPYWIGIILFALIYGLAESLTASAIASGMYILFSPIKYNWNPLLWQGAETLPLYFMLTGSLLGVFSLQRKTQLVEKELINLKLKEEVAQLHQITDQLTRSNLNLEKKIVFRLETFQSVYEIAEKLNKLHLDQLYEAIPQLVAKYCEAEQCSLYLLGEDGSLTLKSNHGWTGMDLFPVRFDSTSELVEKLHGFKETVVLSPESLQKMRVDAYFVVALIPPERKPLGIIKIESIELLKVSQESLKFLSQLSKWFIQSIINGLRYAERERESTFDPRTGLVREDTFWFMVKKIVAGAVRHKYETVLLLVQIVFPDSIGSIEKNMLISRIGGILKRTCRIDDEVGIADSNRSYSFMLMMPHTNEDQARVVITKVYQTISEQLSAVYSFVEEPDFLIWEVLSLGNGSLFLSETVQKMIFDPILAGKT